MGLNEAAKTVQDLCIKRIKQGDYSSSVRISTRSKPAEPLLGRKGDGRIIVKTI